MKDKPECCQSCHYETDAIDFYEGGPGKLDAWLCHLCASSLAGNVYEYYKLYGPDASVLSGIIMNAANQIIAEIRKNRPQELSGRAEPKADPGLSGSEKEHDTGDPWVHSCGDPNCSGSAACKGYFWDEQ